MVSAASAPARRLHAQRCASLGWCVLAVVCAHVVVLVMPSRPAIAQLAHAATVQPLQVRFVQSSRLQRSAPQAEQLPAADRTETLVVRKGRTQLQEERPKPKAAAQPMAEPVAGGSPALLRSADPDADYLPRSALTRAPRAQAPVAIDYPFFDGEADHYTGEFDLFIDDTGAVVRVTTATPDLPGLLSHAVREAFLAARFVPGEVDGLPVRSRVRIEVTFDSHRQTSS